MSASDCPCGSGAAYARCCARWHQGAPAPDAEALMRSRYSAYALGLEPYLIATWHESARPASLHPDPATRWLGLDVRKHVTEGADAARVEFVARFRVGGGPAVRLHEFARFVRENGRWYYVDGEFPGAGER